MERFYSESDSFVGDSSGSSLTEELEAGFGAWGFEEDLRGKYGIFDCAWARDGKCIETLKGMVQVLWGLEYIFSFYSLFDPLLPPPSYLIPTPFSPYSSSSFSSLETKEWAIGAQERNCSSGRKTCPNSRQIQQTKQKLATLEEEKKTLESVNEECSHFASNWRRFNP